ncbi:MAG: hypothetical protein ABW328_05000 [Ilumatobacteraceae bacterium]
MCRRPVPPTAPAVAAKELVGLAAHRHCRRAIERREELLPVVFGSAGAREGATAFIEKRAPRRQGR